MWRNRIARGLLIGVGLVNLAPGVGVLSSDRLEALYGVPVADADLELLLRHRAVLLAAVGAGLVAGAVTPTLRTPAVLVGGASMGSYVALAAAVGGTNEQLTRVAWVDVAALAALGVAAGLGRTRRPVSPVA
ncbi:hypothetical protein GCM10023094_28980 [Rhodococcus olei]|uniref:Phosphopantetheine adenylyltransferase n=1 Tax=Rhodococcus olei TaxID=2161675 RepID=A0ABP8P6B2_9NOCA